MSNEFNQKPTREFFGLIKHYAEEVISKPPSFFFLFFFLVWLVCFLGYSCFIRSIDTQLDFELELMELLCYASFEPRISFSCYHGVGIFSGVDNNYFLLVLLRRLSCCSFVVCYFLASFLFPFFFFLVL
eukprot:m.60816 g.60816  ORF g.60816 m.60816 type:complete len:129 (+) comp7962_c0_seq5:3480-3866(+)